MEHLLERHAIVFLLVSDFKLGVIIATFLFMAGIVFFTILILFFRSAKGKGIRGEGKVKRKLGRNKTGERYIINNITLRYGNDKTAQIDHILIRKNGIFVIETKNYSGWIFGSEEQKQWTQTLAYGKSKKRFYSPILQNQTHINALKEVLNLQSGFFSIIVFTNGKLKGIDLDYVGSLRVIDRIVEMHRTKVFTERQIENIYRFLLSIK